MTEHTKTKDNVLNNDNDLRTMIVAADNTGYVSHTFEGKTYYLVSPVVHVGEGPDRLTGAEHLLEMPSSRSAYSDRTAWLMAFYPKRYIQLLQRTPTPRVN